MQKKTKEHIDNNNLIDIIKSQNNKEEVKTMSEKEKKILETFGNIIPNLTELEKEKLLSYGEGYAAGIRSREELESWDSGSKEDTEVSQAV